MDLPYNNNYDPAASYDPKDLTERQLREGMMELLRNRDIEKDRGVARIYEEACKLLRAELHRRAGRRTDTTTKDGGDVPF